MASYARQVCTDEIRAALLEIQDGRCPGCGSDLSRMPERLVHVEHNPTTGRLRGIVCHRDNIRLRFVDSDAHKTVYDNLDSLTAYIEHPPADDLPENLRNSDVDQRGVPMCTKLSKDVARTLRTYSLATGIPVTSIISDALRDFLARQDAIADLERVLAASGTDLVDFAAAIIAEEGRI